MSHKRTRNEVAEYYRQSAWLYKYFWYSKKSLGLNYGFWEKNTKNLDEAVNNHFQYLIDKAKIRKDMRVLDAGCGVGGGAIFIAKNTAAKVTGITITPSQVGEAKKNIDKNGVAKLVDIKLMDYTKTSFPNNYFDVVFGVESICYANPKSKFLKEVFRILKPGGVIIVSDGYCVHKPKDEEEESILRRFCDGWRIERLIEYSEMTKEMKEAGFRDIQIEDMTQMVLPSFRKIRWLVNLAKPITWLLTYWESPILKVVRDNAVSLEMSVLGVERGLFGHFTHLAKK